MGWFGGKHEKKTQRSSSSRKVAPAATASRATDPMSNYPVTGPESAMLPTSNNQISPKMEAPPQSLAVERGVGTPEEQIYAVEEQINSNFTADEETAHEAYVYEEATRQNHLNSLFNGHLMKWKFEAEEGSTFIRVPAFFGALGLIVTDIVAFVLHKDALEIHAIVMGIFVLVMGIFICILDGRFLATNPLSTRAHLRNIITRNFNMFRFVWGRGLLYIVAGVVHISQMWLMTMISGAVMAVVGFIAIIVGVHASRKFAALRNSLADESFLLLVFGNYDSDGDGYLAPNEFALLLANLGMELDDRYTLKAFNVIDTDSDRRIAFDEFHHWWASGYIERGRRTYITDDDEDHSYRRM